MYVIILMLVKYDTSFTDSITKMMMIHQEQASNHNMNVNNCITIENYGQKPR